MSEGTGYALGALLLYGWDLERGEAQGFLAEIAGAAERRTVRELRIEPE